MHNNTVFIVATKGKKEKGLFHMATNIFTAVILPGQIERVNLPIMDTYNSNNLTEFKI